MPSRVSCMINATAVNETTRLIVVLGLRLLIRAAAALTDGLRCHLINFYPPP